MGTDIREAAPNTFMYRETSIDEQHFNTSYQPIISRASDDLISVDASTKDNETDGEGSQDGP